MKFPAYTDDAYWTDVIEQYIQNNNNHPGWYNIEYYMWEYFKDCLKRNNRFFFAHPLLPVLESEFNRNACILPKGTAIYRARIDCDSKLWNAYCRIESEPKQLQALEKRDVPAAKLAELWKAYEDFINSEKTKEIKERIESGFQGFDASGSSAPPQGKASSGRCNPEGVPYLYAAQEEHTAIAEIRPFIRDSISVAVLKPVRDLRLVNFDFEPTAVVNGRDFLFDDIRRDFAKINKTQNSDYFITQFIASLIEHLGYDGLCFRSSLVKDGTNYVIFNPSICSATSSKLVYLSEVNYVCGQCK
jgi:hypothetical protein